MKRIGRWLFRIVLACVAVFVVIYIADWAVYKLRGSPQGKVTVNRYITVPLKGNKQEYDYIGTGETNCSQSLFPQGNESPCWQLRRNPNIGMAL